MKLPSEKGREWGFLKSRGREGAAGEEDWGGEIGMTKINLIGDLSILL
jgi:hypothetical protein